MGLQVKMNNSAPCESYSILCKLLNYHYVSNEPAFMSLVWMTQHPWSF